MLNREYRLQIEEHIEPPSVMRLVVPGECKCGALGILGGRADNEGEDSGFCLGGGKGSNSYGRTGCGGEMNM